MNNALQARLLSSAAVSETAYAAHQYSLARRVARLDRRAESVPKIGGGVPRRLLCPSEEASAKDGWLNPGLLSAWN